MTQRRLTMGHQGEGFRLPAGSVVPLGECLAIPGTVSQEAVASLGSKRAYVSIPRVQSDDLKNNNKRV